VTFISLFGHVVGLKVTPGGASRVITATNGSNGRNGSAGGASGPNAAGPHPVGSYPQGYGNFNGNSNDNTDHQGMNTDVNNESNGTQRYRPANAQAMMLNATVAQGNVESTRPSIDAGGDTLSRDFDSQMGPSESSDAHRVVYPDPPSPQNIESAAAERALSPPHHVELTHGEGMDVIENHDWNSPVGEQQTPGYDINNIDPRLR